MFALTLVRAVILNALLYYDVGGERERGFCECGVQALQHTWRTRGQPLGAGSPYLPCPTLAFLLATL